MAATPLLNVTAARRRWQRRLRGAVLDELESEHGLRYRAAAERALVDAGSTDVTAFAFREGMDASPSNAPAIARRFVAAYDRGDLR